MNADQTTSQDNVPPAVDPLHGQPHQIVERDGVRYTLLGTAHISQASIDAVRAAIDSGAYDTVAVELDAGRLQSLSDPDALARMDIVKVLRDGKTHLFAANLPWRRTSGGWPSSWAWSRAPNSRRP